MVFEETQPTPEDTVVEPRKTGPKAEYSSVQATEQTSNPLLRGSVRVGRYEPWASESKMPPLMRRTVRY